MRKSNFKRLRVALTHLPYRPAVRIMRVLTGSNAVRRWLFPRTTKAIEDVYRDTCGIPCDDRSAQLIVMSKALVQLQQFKIEAFSDREFEGFVRVRGLDTVQDLCASDRGVVIAAAHFTTARALFPALDRLGIRPYRLMRSRPGIVQHDRDITTYDKAPFFGLREVHEILKGGGPVMALPDGRQGTSNITHAFFGHDCGFKKGIFDIALSLGCAIVPVVIWMDIDGGITVDFHQPLQSDGPHDSPSANLVHNYVDVLEAAIRARPWSFDPLRLALFWSGTAAD